MHIRFPNSTNEPQPNRFSREAIAAGRRSGSVRPRLQDCITHYPSAAVWSRGRLKSAPENRDCRSLRPAGRPRAARSAAGRIAGESQSVPIPPASPRRRVPSHADWVIRNFGGEDEACPRHGRGPPSTHHGRDTDAAALSNKVSRGTRWQRVSPHLLFWRAAPLRDCTATEGLSWWWWWWWCVTLIPKVSAHSRNARLYSVHSQENALRKYIPRRVH